MRIDFVTLFPEMVLGALGHSMISRAQQQGIVEFGTSNPRDFATDNHHTVDDSPYGGGPGMVIRADVVGQAIDSLSPTPETTIIALEPWGKRFTQQVARRLSKSDHLVFLCGHYEGIDARVAEHYNCEVLSLGDFILTGGEPAAITMTDSIVRLLPGVLGDQDSLETDSHSGGLLSYPQYTRPAEWRGLTPPEVLKSGDHKKIETWRRKWALEITRKNRPDLFSLAALEPKDIDLL